MSCRKINVTVSDEKIIITKTIFIIWNNLLIFHQENFNSCLLFSSIFNWTSWKNVAVKYFLYRLLNHKRLWITTNKYFSTTKYQFKTTVSINLGFNQFIKWHTLVHFWKYPETFFVTQLVDPIKFIYLAPGNAHAEIFYMGVDLRRCHPFKWHEHYFGTQICF